MLKRASDTIDNRDSVIVNLNKTIKDYQNKINSDQDILIQSKQDSKNIADLNDQIENLNYKNKELENKVKITQTFLDEKTNECDTLLKQVNSYKNFLADCENELHEFKNDCDNEIDSLKQQLQRYKTSIYSCSDMYSNN